MNNNNNSYDDDDFLDDILDDFTATQQATVTASSKPTTTNNSNNNHAQPPHEEEEIDPSEFERQLQLGMEQLLAGFGSASNAGNVDETVEKLLGSLKKAATKDASSASNASDAKEDSFKNILSDTVNTLKDSNQKVEGQIKDAALDESSPEDMEAMMKELEEMMGSADFEDMFGNVMSQLMTRDMLYEPMKDLVGKYPEYLDANASTISEEDMTRFRGQQRLIVEILKVYDDRAISGEDEGKKVADLMQQMQEYGNPPEGVLTDLAPGMGVGADGMPAFPFPGLRPDANPDCCIM
ncbi:Peroxisome chaperone and import receptor [Chytriomyces hyalinus]|nr:Peroxisome chaperone and import receptor [Chytriomyces hyalinus]